MESTSVKIQNNPYW